MRVLTKVCHDDHDLGDVYELDGEHLERFLRSGTVVPADEWTYRYQKPGRGGDQEEKHLFTRVAPRTTTEVAPDTSAPIAPAPLDERAPAPTTTDPASPLTRTEG